MKIKENNESNESDLFVKKSKSKGKKRKSKKYNSNHEINTSNIYKYILYILILILLITILFFVILFNLFRLKKEESKIENENNEIPKNDIVNNENITNNMSIIYFNPSKRRDNYLIGHEYIKKCLDDDLSKKFEKVEKPIISVIIPAFNCENSIKGAISSIQNQNISDIEIILINDFSTDQTLNIIQNIQKNDQRIIIINNQKNMGSLYSRSIGSLMAKGNFTFALDNDDMFFQEDVLDITHKISIEGNFDIVGFKAVYVGNYNDDINKMFDGYFSFKANNLILYQPQLGLYPVTYKGQYSANDFTIWGKCIKTEIYKKATNSLGTERYSKFLSWCEDSSIVFIIFNIAQSYIFIHKYGILHLKSRITATYTQSNNNKLLGEIFLLDILFDFSKNNSDKNIAVSHAVNINYRYNLTDINNSTKLYFNSVLKKILNCSLITKFKKSQIKYIYNRINKN